MFAENHIIAKLDKEILTALDKLDPLEAESEEYATIVDRIAKLHKLKSEEVQNSLKSEETESKLKFDGTIKPPSMDTALVVVANIFGILWLTRYERENVISSKALGFVMKPR